MLGRTYAVSLLGLTGEIVEIEADLSSNLPAFVLIGLPDAALGEAKDRVRAAAINSGCGLPNRKITVNLSPAALPKHGSGFDLAIALAALAAAGTVSAESIGGVLHLGELGLDGRLRPINGVLPAVLAAAGGHHVFLLGPPGAGKTMLAARLPGLLPDLSARAALEVSSIRSLAGMSVGRSLVRRPPFEAPHHTASAAALVGGGSGQIRPGAAARASDGVLFLDEAPEFSPSVLDALRQPLESGLITIHRANAVATFPGRFQLVMAANPCPCGQYGARDSECTCPPAARRRYVGRLSGPLLDRIDIQLRVQRITAAQLRLAHEARGVSSAAARARVSVARAAAAERLVNTPWQLNSQVPGAWLRGPGVRLAPAVTASIDRALERGGITMRGYDRVLRLAWTIADLAGDTSPNAAQLGQALYLRRAMSN